MSMNGYDYEAAPKSDHGRVVTSGAWLGAIVGMSGVGWLDMRLPGLLAWALEWAVVLGTCYAMAAWKRAWYAWAAFWGMAALCPLAGILRLAGALDSQWSAASWWVACMMVFAWYWLVRIPRLQPAVEAIERHEVHVIHHVIHHGRELPGWVGAEVTDETAAPIPAPTRKVIAGSARAISQVASSWRGQR